MNQETIITELLAGFLGLSGLLGLLFRWLINSLSQKLDKAVDAIEQLSAKIGELAIQQRVLQQELFAKTSRAEKIHEKLNEEK